MACFPVNTGILFFKTAEESRINTDEPYLSLCYVCVFAREGLDLEL